jgi:hypothetical protein
VPNAQKSTFTVGILYRTETTGDFRGAPGTGMFSWAAFDFHAQNLRVCTARSPDSWDGVSADFHRLIYMKMQSSPN